MRATDDNSFEEDTTNAFGDTILNLGTSRRAEDEEYERDEEKGVSRGVTELIGDGGEEIVLA